MNIENKNIAIAALDIGTSQIKIGVYFPPISDKIIILDSYKNELDTNNNKDVLSDFSLTQEISDKLFKKLGKFTTKNKITTLYIGICSHVSSLLEWNMETAKPVSNKFPIWLDSSCNDQIEDFKKYFENENDQKLIGSFLPPGTNWLFTKLLNIKKKNLKNNHKYLQIGDTIFFNLSGEYYTNSSSQVSIVHQQKNNYVPEILSFLDINTKQLPTIKNHELTAVMQSKCREYSFPMKTLILPSMADFYASFFGLGLKMNEAFILGNTSEIAGIYSDNSLQESNRFVTVSLNKGKIMYGSTNTGGNLINWFFDNIVNTKNTAQSIKEFTEKAAQISPADTPIFLPYLEGERAPLWNSKLSASFIGLRAFHTNIHLFRAILEAVAFARKQCFEHMNNNNNLKIVKMGGGTSQNSLWNEIRASVLDCPISVTEEKEIAITGVINNIIDILPNYITINKPVLNFTSRQGNTILKNIYINKYKEFIKYQAIMKNI